MSCNYSPPGCCAGDAAAAPVPGGRQPAQTVLAVRAEVRDVAFLLGRAVAPCSGEQAWRAGTCASAASWTPAALRRPSAGRPVRRGSAAPAASAASWPRAGRCGLEPRTRLSSCWLIFRCFCRHWPSVRPVQGWLLCLQPYFAT